MKNAKLTSRQKSIIEILTKSSQINPITVSEISAQLKISSRTVLRQMADIEQWLTENGFKFSKKPGVGMIIDESLENQQLILELLEIEKVENNYLKEDRIKLITGELLVSKEPLKSFYFTSKFKISDGTLSNDLDYIQNQLKTYSIDLIRKPGLGIFIKANEDNLRRAIASMLYDTLDENEMIEILNGKITKHINPKIEISIKNRLLNFIDKDTIKKLEEVLLETEEKLKIKYTDSAYIGLIVHISLAIKRIQNNENIVMDKKVLDELSILNEFSLAEEIAKNIEKEFNINIPKDEIGYITMHLKGAKLRLNISKNELNIQNINIAYITEEIISSVEKQLNVSFKNNSNLRNDLTNHLVPAINRLSMNMDIKNPQLEVMKTKYSEIYNASEKACTILENIGINSIPESEIAYIAMHFGAALMSNNYFDNEITAVIVCPTGLGTSKLLSVGLKNEFPNINIKSIISAINIDIEKLKKENIDLIISTVDISVDYKSIKVNPILFKQDKQLIENVMSEIKNVKRLLKKQDDKEEKKLQKKINKKDICEISKIGEEIISIIENTELKELIQINIIDELFEKAAELFDFNNLKSDIKEKLLERESINSTYINDFEMMFMHCKCNIKSSRFGVIRLENPFISEGRKIIGSLIILIPEKNSEFYSNIMSEISGAVIERKGFFDILKTKDIKAVKFEIEEILSEFYLKEIKKRMEM